MCAKPAEPTYTDKSLTVQCGVQGRKWDEVILSTVEIWHMLILTVWSID